MRFEYSNTIEITQLDLSDRIMRIGNLDEDNYEIFRVVEGTERLYEFNDSVQLAITYELNRDLRIIRRHVYSILDYLGDLGGLSSSLFALFAVCIIVFQYKAAINYVSSRLYLVRKNKALGGMPTPIKMSGNKVSAYERYKTQV